MFGFVTANMQELTQEQRQRYRSVYCGICRRIGQNAGSGSRLCLTYDLVFLVLLLSSLYEPEETPGAAHCLPHPIVRQDHVDSPIVSYGADMNVILGYHVAEDHRLDSRRPELLSRILRQPYDSLRQQYSRQCGSIEENLKAIHALEQANCPDPDLPANCFGKLLGELFVWQEDQWAGCLRQLGHSLGRFIYLADAAMDYPKDARSGNYNPFIAMGGGVATERWNEYLTGEMADCAAAFERLPLVQDKGLLDNIIYSGIWLTYRQKEKKVRRRADHDRRSL